MKIQQQGSGRWRIAAGRYTLSIDRRLGLARLDFAGSCQRHVFFLGGACHTVGQRDDTTAIPRVTVRQKSEGVLVTVSQRSSLWKKRETHYVLRADSMEIFHRIEGSGLLDRVMYQRGFLEGNERGFSGEVDEIYSTSMNFLDKSFFHPCENFAISAGNDALPAAGGENQALASPCYCAGLRERSEAFHVSVGLAAAPGSWTWDAFEWNPPVSRKVTPALCDNMMAGGWAAVYAGKQQVDGCWESPRLVMTLVATREQVLPKYLRHCRQHGYLPKPPARRRVPAWWREPIYCTWHDQIGLAASRVGHDLVAIGNEAFKHCTEERCEHWLDMLIRKGCRPGIIILDATWAKNLNSGEPDPAKWHDMRAWVESCHARGIRVFAWAAAWSTDGVPAEECMTRKGQPVAADITHPDYVRRFKEMIRRWFSDAPDCLNMDGVKLDGQLSLPTGADLENHSGVWGLELQHLYLKTLYGEAKSHKRDACISVFSLNPYLAEFTDMVRLADMYTHQPSPVSSMRRRAELFRICQPQAVVDTDGLLHFNALDTYAAEFPLQSEVGVPCLYNAEWVYRSHFFQPPQLTKLTAEDYRIVKKTFSSWRRSNR